MTLTSAPIAVPNFAGTSTPLISYTDGTNNAVAHVLLDATGALISPATSGLQTTGNTSLASIATNTAAGATAANQATANTSLATIASNLPAKGAAVSASSLPVVIASDQGALPLPTGAATSAAQNTGNTSLAAIATSVAATATNTSGLATAAAQTTANTSLAAIASSSAAIASAASTEATAAKQDTGNTSLSNIDADLGAKADSAATTDTGTFSLISLFKRLLASTTTLVTACQAATPAGTNVIGKVGFDQTTPGTTNGVQVNAALPVGANLIGAVTSPGTVHLTAAPTVTAAAYTSGQVVGGLISLTGAARINAGSGTIQTAMVTVKTALTAPFDIFFFDTNPSNSTFTDNAALAINVADLPSLCGVAHCVDLVAGGTPQILLASNTGIPFKLSASSTTLYAVIVMRGAETLGSTSAIGLSVVIYQD